MEHLQEAKGNQTYQHSHSHTRRWQIVETRVLVTHYCEETQRNWIVAAEKWGLERLSSLNADRQGFA